MRIDPLGLGVALTLALSFAALGEVILWRRSLDPFSWNESFLVGAGTSAAVLFPLSLLSPSGALRCVFAALAFALAGIVIREIARRPRARNAGGNRAGLPWRRDPVALALLAALALVVVAFTALVLRYSHFWDGFQIWATKAQLLYFRGALSRFWFPEDAYDSRILEYPPLVPLQEALLSMGRGRFDFDAVKPVFLPLYASMLLSTFAAAQSATGSVRAALAAALLLALLRQASAGTAAGGYADMPLAAFVAGAVAAGLRSGATRGGGSAALPWLVGSLTTVKSEGILLAGAGCAAVLAFWALEAPRRAFARALASWRGVAVVLAFVGIRVAYVRWLGIHDITYGPLDAAHFERARRILGTVARVCARVAMDPASWGFFWPAFLVAAALVAVLGANRERSLALAVGGAIAIDTTIFLFTNWDPELQITQAYPRLLLQVAPAAAVVIATGYVRARKAVAPTGLRATGEGASP